MDPPEEDKNTPGSSGATKEHGSGPSMAMRSLMSAVRASFPTVRQLNTSALFKLMGEAPGRPNHGLLILDTREKSEYDVSHLPGARWLDPATTDGELSTFVHYLPSKLPSQYASLDLVCYCSVGYRSSKMAARLEAALKSPVPAAFKVAALTCRYCGARMSDCEKGEGVPGCAGPVSAAEPTPPDTNVFNLEGGIFQWANENQRLVDASHRDATQHVHPYSVVWGQLIDAARRKWS